MNKNKTRLFLCSLLWLISLALLAWCEWPIKPISREIVFLPGKLIISPADGSVLDPAKPQVFPEERRLILKWTPIMRMGDLSRIELSFVVDKASMIEKSTLPSTVTDFENVYNKFSITAEARMELEDAEVNPGGLSGHVLPKERDIHFTWTVKPGKAGNFEGTTWFYLKLFPLNGREVFEQAISAQTVSIKVISLLGLNSNYWRFLGVIGLISGFIMLKIENIKSIIYSIRQKLSGKRKY